MYQLLVRSLITERQNRGTHNVAHRHVRQHEILHCATSEIGMDLRFLLILECGPGSSVGIATDYRLDGPGSNPGEDEIFRQSRPALGPTQPPVKWVPGLSPGVKCGRYVLLTTHPLLVPRSWKSRAIPLPTFWATPGL